jgi:hypothetical protein
MNLNRSIQTYIYSTGLQVDSSKTDYGNGRVIFELISLTRGAALLQTNVVKFEFSVTSARVFYFTI